MIESIRISGLCINSITPADSVLTVSANVVTDFMIEAYDANMETNPQYSWKVDNVLMSETSETLHQAFTEPGDHLVSCTISFPGIEYTLRWHVTVNPSANEDNTSIKPDLNILACAPNPFKEKIYVSYKGSRNELVNFEIFNLKGQKIFSKSINTEINKIKQTEWTGLDSAGSKVPAGIYFISLKNNQTQSIKKVLYLK